MMRVFIAVYILTTLPNGPLADKRRCTSYGCRCFKANSIAMCVDLNLTRLPLFNPLVASDIKQLSAVGNRICCIDINYLTAFRRLDILDLRGQRVPINCTSVKLTKLFSVKVLSDCVFEHSTRTVNDSIPLRTHVEYGWSWTNTVSKTIFTTRSTTFTPTIIAIEVKARWINLAAIILSVIIVLTTLYRCYSDRRWYSCNSLQTSTCDFTLVTDNSFA